ncbi:hypothetical protein B2M26_00650 [Ferroacidibacillus organovorans]|uniref:Uncharacterized protein n=2 Tax=Ferroacidibacillus organovorans TaxID=1765683 RepID=A0A1V4EXS5_9BACL|nr:hypothetical protein B2M26_00650 [Ferroacidibacillus organovorans]
MRSANFGYAQSYPQILCITLCITLWKSEKIFACSVVIARDCEEKRWRNVDMNQEERFIEAIKTNDHAVVKDSLQIEPGLMEVKLNGISPLMLSVYYGARDVTAVFLSRGVELNLFEASALGQHDSVLRELDCDSAALNAYSADGFTALGLSAFFGHEDIARELLKRGAAVDVPSKNAMRVAPLHSAVAHQHTRIAELLLAHGANVNLTQQDGYTPLLEAVENGQHEMVQLLVAHGADIHQASERGVTPLQMAETMKRDDLLQIMRETHAQ